MKKTIAVSSIIALLLLLLSACAGKTSEVNQGATPLPTAPAPTAPAPTTTPTPTTPQPSPVTAPAVGNQVGNLAPDFQLKNLDGKSVSLSDFKGKPVWLNFWATW